MATVFVTAQGLKVTVEDAKCVQANAFVQAAIFHHFLLTQDQVTFKINLSVLIVSTKLRSMYSLNILKVAFGTTLALTQVVMDTDMHPETKNNPNLHLNPNSSPCPGL